VLWVDVAMRNGSKFSWDDAFGLKEVTWWLFSCFEWWYDSECDLCQLVKYDNELQEKQIGNSRLGRIGLTIM